MQPAALNCRDLVSALQSGELTASDLTAACLSQIDAHDATTGAFLHCAADAARAAAAQIDERRAAGERLAPIAGLPVAVKDALCTLDQPTTCGSRILKTFQPPYDATVVERLRAAGAVLIGKTNLDEFAMGSSTENSAYHVTRNPWNPERVPGGSSGGSAACVAAGMAPLAIGTDTGGSIRQPASFCGISGLKPTYGRVSRYGLVAYASSLDQIGPMARDAYGAALLLQAISGPDPRDSTCVDHPVPDYLDSLDTPLEGLRLGIVREHFTEGLDEEVRSAVEAALDAYRSLGAEIREIDLPHTERSVATYYLIASSEASSNLARYDGIHYAHRSDNFDGRQDSLLDLYCRSRGEGFGDEAKRRIMLGTYALSQGYYDAYYLKAMKVRRLIRQDFERAFEQVDLVVGPTTPTAAFQLGAFLDDPLAMYLNDIYTIGANLAGLPGMSVPAGFTGDGLPIGLQLQAPPFAEDRILRAARMLETQTTWWQQTAACVPQP